jgi:hypothetical protein
MVSETTVEDLLCWSIFPFRRLSGIAVDDTTACILPTKRVGVGAGSRFQILCLSSGAVSLLSSLGGLGEAGGVGVGDEADCLPLPPLLNLACVTTTSGIRDEDRLDLREPATDLLGIPGRGSSVCEASSGESRSMPMCSSSR